MPPHCPNPDCRYHLHQGAPDEWPWCGRGLRRVHRAPYWVRQLSCKVCGRWFRSSVFGPDYWKKVPGLSARVLDLLHNGCALRQAARVVHRGPTTVRWHVRLLAKQAQLISVEDQKRLEGKIREPIVLDGTRSFAGSQSEPLEFNTSITSESGFELDVNAFGLRRSGTMRPDQRLAREQRDARLGRPAPLARRKAVAAQIRRLLKLCDGRLWLWTDEEPDYALVTNRHKGRIEHRTVSSRARRDAKNPLWKVNCLHAYARHSLRALVRETIAFAKTSSALLDRMLIFQLARNHMKGISERRADLAAITPAMRLGLDDRRLGARAVLARRRFPKRCGLPPDLEAAYRGTFKARPNENSKPYIHRYVS